MRHVSDKQVFCDNAPAAGSIFSYVASHPSLARFTLQFEYGMIDDASKRAVAKFSCVYCPGCRNAVVWVSALTQIDGTWSLTHSVGSIT